MGALALCAALAAASPSSARPGGNGVGVGVSRPVGGNISGAPLRQFGTGGYYGAVRNPGLRNNGFGYVYGTPPVGNGVAASGPNVRSGFNVREGFDAGTGIRQFGDGGYYGAVRNPTLRNNGFGYVYGSPGQTSPFPARRGGRGQTGGDGFGYGAYGAAGGYAGYPAYGTETAVVGCGGSSSVTSYDDAGHLNSFHRSSRC